MVGRLLGREVVGARDDVGEGAGENAGEGARGAFVGQGPRKDDWDNAVTSVDVLMKRKRKKLKIIITKIKSVYENWCKIVSRTVGS